MSWLPGKKYFEGGICTVTRNMANQVVIVTGSSSGIGLQTVKGLAERNATIVLATRNKAKTEPLMDEIKRETGNANVDFIPLDLIDLKSVKTFAQEFKTKYNHLDVLINNAAITYLRSAKTFTKDGFEESFGTTYIGHYYLTRLLLDTIRKTKNSRIIFSSTKSATKTPLDWEDLNAEKKFSNLAASVQGKRSSLMFASELQRRLESDSVKVVSFHPGWVKTEGRETADNPTLVKIMSKIFGFFMLYFGKNAAQGAQTSLYCTLEDWDKLKKAGYYSDCEEFNYPPQEDLRPENTQKLWDLTDKWIKEKLGDEATFSYEKNISYEKVAIFL